MVQKMFDAPTHDELTEQELDPLMREALLDLDLEEEGSVPTRRHQEEIWCGKVARSCRAEPWVRHSEPDEVDTIVGS